MELSPLMLLIGLFIPALMGLVTRLIKDSDGRFWASALICTIVGGLVNYIERNGVYTGLTMSDIVYSIASSAFSMIGLAKVSYQAIWDNKAVSKLLPDEIAKDTETPLKAMGLQPKK